MLRRVRDMIPSVLAMVLRISMVVPDSLAAVAAAAVGLRIPSVVSVEATLSDEDDMYYDGTHGFMGHAV